jgi:N-acetylmuramoyl-L-alanine amidase
MSDDNRFPPNGEGPAGETPANTPDRANDVSASGEFLDMMRQAAARASKTRRPEPSWADPPIPQRPARPKPSTPAEPGPPAKPADPTPAVPAASAETPPTPPDSPAETEPGVRKRMTLEVPGRVERPKPTPIINGVPTAGPDRTDTGEQRAVWPRPTPVINGVRTAPPEVEAAPELPPVVIEQEPAPTDELIPETADEDAEEDAVEVDPEEDEYRLAVLRERERRLSRRKTRRRSQAVGVFGGMFRALIVVFVAAGLMATIFTWWTPPGFLSNNLRQDLSAAMATQGATPAVVGQPTPNWARRIGVVSGHRGPENDPGAVCPDGLTEAEINFNVSSLVVQNLRGLGYNVDLLDEFDTRLNNYQAAALVSVHANSCQDYGEPVSGYLIAAAAARITARGNDDLLVGCISQHYGELTGLERRPGVTIDMTDYHSFREIHAFTPAAIIELGFLRGDRELLTTRPDLLARAITDGVLCFLEPGELGIPLLPQTN